MCNSGFLRSFSICVTAQSSFAARKQFTINKKAQNSIVMRLLQALQNFLKHISHRSKLRRLLTDCSGSRQTGQFKCIIAGTLGSSVAFLLRFGAVAEGGTCDDELKASTICKKA